MEDSTGSEPRASDLGATDADEEQARLQRAALLSMLDSACVLIRDGRIVRAVGESSVGYTPGSLEGRHVAEFAYPDDLPDVLDLVARVQAGDEVSTAIRLRLWSDRDGWVEAEGLIADHRDDPLLHGTVLQLRRSRSDEQQPGARVLPSATSAAVESTGALASLAEVVPAGILATDLNGFVVYANAATRQMFDNAEEQISGQGWRRIVHPDDVREVALTSVAALRGLTRERLFRILAGKEVRWILGRFAPLRVDGQITGLVASFDDVTTQREVESALAHRATHDPLTELPNRVLLRDRLTLALGRVERSHEELAVLFIDLDGFKAVNDELGHSTGDRVLAAVAQRLLDAVRPADTVARYGGDEFVVVCEGLGEAEARSLAGRLVESLASVPVDGPGGRSVGGCIGIAIVTGQWNADEVLRQADTAMYQAKHYGPGSVEVTELR